MVAAATTYMFDAYIHLTTEETSRTPSFGFGETVTFTSCTYLSNGVTGSASSVNSSSMRELETASAAISLGAATGVRTRIRLVSSCQGQRSGYHHPADHLQRRPDRHPNHQHRSFFYCYPIGTYTVTPVAAWA